MTRPSVTRSNLVRALICMAVASTVLAGPATGHAGACDNEPEDIFVPFQIGTFASGLIGVDPGTGGSMNISVCAELTATSQPLLDERVVIVFDDKDPGRTGTTVAVRYCSLYNGGNCTPAVPIGAETEGVGDCGTGAGTCVGVTDFYPSGDSISRTGVDRSSLTLPPTISGVGPIDCVPICYQATQYDFGQVTLWVDGTPTPLPICFTVPPPQINGGHGC